MTINHAVWFGVAALLIVGVAISVALGLLHHDEAADVAPPPPPLDLRLERARLRALVDAKPHSAPLRDVWPPDRRLESRRGGSR
jgi:hypothetical protein